MAVTKPRQFRFDDTTIALMDSLGKQLGLTSRAEVVRLALTRLAQDQPGETEKKPKNKTDKK